jgi:uncharacterized MnhB-related membrane protein
MCLICKVDICLEILNSFMLMLLTVCSSFLLIISRDLLNSSCLVATSVLYTISKGSLECTDAAGESEMLNLMRIVLISDRI